MTIGGAAWTPRVELLFFGRRLTDAVTISPDPDQEGLGDISIEPDMPANSAFRQVAGGDWRMLWIGVQEKGRRGRGISHRPSDAESIANGRRSDPAGGGRIFM
jgi:hypothetical protein